MDAALKWVLSRPWCILPADLETICAVAARVNEAPEAVEARLGRPLENTRLITYREAPDGSRVAILPVHGPIARYANLFTEISGATSVQVLATDVQAALDDPAVRSIVMEVNSPGGEATGINDLAQLIRAGRQRKPIVAFIDGAGASGAYWLASAASRVVTSGTGMLGSIGVVMKTWPPNDKPGAPLETVSSGAPYKRIDNRTDEGKAHLQALVNDLEAVFVAEVAAGRGVAEARVRSDFGKGGLLVGAKAVAAGMADAVGTLESVVADLSAGRLPGRDSPPPRSKVAPMSFKDKVAAWFAKGQPEDFDPEAEGHSPPPPAPPKRPDPPAPPPPVLGAPLAPTLDATASDRAAAELRKEIDELKKARRADALAAIRQRTLQFAQRPDVAARVTPKELPILASLYEALARVDFEHAAEAIQVNVPTDKPGETAPADLATALTRCVLARPPHRLYQEMIPADAAILYPGATLLAADGEGQDPTAAKDEEWAAEKARRRNGPPAAKAH